MRGLQGVYDYQESLTAEINELKALLREAWDDLEEWHRNDEGNCDGHCSTIDLTVRIARELGDDQ